LLRLEARDYRDLARWRWALTDEATGAFIADHEVRLDARDWQFEAFADLTGYLSWHVAPDRQAEDEARIVSDVGAWIGSQVLGQVVAALAERQSATVRVVVPPEAAELLYHPLELALVNGKPLAAQGVTLVMDTGTAGAATTGPPGDRLRVLGLFSLPEGSHALNLRRERVALVALIKGIAATGKAAHVRVLQYGVTRDRLRDVLREAEGWDIIHVSGHGRPGELLLETAAGQPDPVSQAELAELLSLARGRVQLVTLSACWSAAIMANEQRRLFGLPAQGRGQDRKANALARPLTDREPAPESGALATTLSRHLSCAVLAMRYPVTDEFAIRLSAELYRLLADKGQQLPRALGMTLRQLLQAPQAAGDAAWPMLSLGTPALFGPAAVDLRLAAPSRSELLSSDTDALKMAGFPPAPERFVGRTAVLAQSSAALAPDAGAAGVLLHGMPGGGKTACALELADGHKESFDRLVFYKAPDDGLDITGALTDFAFTLERDLPGFQMAEALVSAERLDGFLPRLTELMEQGRILIVIDNLESLLSESGSWRDDRWGLVANALCARSGPGRLILTSRRLPTVALPGVRVEAVDVLSADEALLLARELPNLSALKLGKVQGIDPNVSKQLARNAITMAQGHPGLLELAEGQASNPGHLLELVKTGDQEWRKLGGVPGGFFASGGSPAATNDDYLQLIAAWTRFVADTLTAEERDLFWFLCCLEERDRQRGLLATTWELLWERLGRDGQPPDLDQALTFIISRGLAAIGTDIPEPHELYSVHAGVAAAGRAHAGKRFQDTVDEEASAFWCTQVVAASGGDGGAVDTRLVVHAGLASVPYMIRQGEWVDAAGLLEGAFVQDPSRANALAILPAIRQITSLAPLQVDVLARVMQPIDPVAAEALMHTCLEAAVARGDYRAASVTAGRLTDLCCGSGRLAEALTLARQGADYSRQAGLGPWTLLLAEVRQLRVLAVTQPSSVLDEIPRLQNHMEALPDTKGYDKDETATPWNVREVLLNTGLNAAINLRQWKEALDLNALVVSSLRGRHAPADEIAQAQFNDYGPLLALGHTDKALQILLKCRQAFLDARNFGYLGGCLYSLADIEDKRGHGDAAIRIQLDGLRYLYLAGDAGKIAFSYHQLGYYLGKYPNQFAVGGYTNQFTLAIAMHLAEAVISDLAGASSTDEALLAVAIDLTVFGAYVTLPQNVADLCHLVDDICSTDLTGLVTRLSPDPETSEQTLRDVIARAQVLAAALPKSGNRSRKRQWSWRRR
jgi:hypothetical protein